MTTAANAPKTLAITGATGFVGRHICRAALERGWRIRALVRDTAEARKVLPTTGVDWLVGDANDPAALRDLVADTGAVIHLIGIRREVKPSITFRRMHVDTTRRIVEACRDAGVRRYLHMSALGTRPNAASAYHKTKWEAEQIVRRSSLDWTIFRPSLIHGADGEFIRMVKAWVTQKAPPFLFIPYFVRVIPGIPHKWETPRIAPVSVDDVAAAFVSALGADDTIGEVFPLAGPESMEWPEMLRTIRDAIPGANVSLQPFGIPADAAWLQAKAAEVLGVGSLLPYGPSDAIMGAEDNVGSPRKAEAILGVKPRSLEPAVRAYAPLV